MMPGDVVQCRCGQTGVVAVIEGPPERVWVQHLDQRHGHSGAELAQLVVRTPAAENAELVVAVDLVTRELFDELGVPRTEEGRLIVKVLNAAREARSLPPL